MSMSFTAISVTRYDAYGLSTDIEDLEVQDEESSINY